MNGFLQIQYADNHSNRNGSTLLFKLLCEVPSILSCCRQASATPNTYRSLSRAWSRAFGGGMKKQAAFQRKEGASIIALDLESRAYRHTELVSGRCFPLFIGRFKGFCNLIANLGASLCFGSAILLYFVAFNRGETRSNRDDWPALHGLAARPISRSASLFPA